jgi:hypothetical protein
MSRVSDADRAVYRALADALLPAHGSLPAASAADVAGANFDRILAWRPDLAPDILRGIAAARSRDPQTALQTLDENDRAAFEAIRFAVLGAYYLDAKVMQAIGYRGQESRPVPDNETADYLAGGILDAVIARGTIWRKAE